MLCLPISGMSQVAGARRVVSALAREAGLSAGDVSKVALVVTEAATNLVRHATEGQLLARFLDDAAGIELLVLDKGPGIANLNLCLRDGYSTVGGSGTGLGAITRLATCWDLYSRLGGGTVMVIQMLPLPAQSASQTFCDVGGISLPKPGEAVCGDGWMVAQRAEHCLAMVVDGLGHGPEAAAASRQAEHIVRERPGDVPAVLLEHIHTALKHTRGAAVMIVAIDLQSLAVTVAGVGNIAGTLWSAEKNQRLLSHNGIVGYQMPRIRTSTYPWSPEMLLVLHSDGLTSRWHLDTYPGLVGRHPGLIAGVLYRDYVRGRDDVTVVVLRMSPR